MNIETIVKSERLTALLNKAEGSPATDDMVARWWGLAQKESQVSAEIVEADARLALMRQRRERIMGGRETVESMIVEADDRVRMSGPGLSLVEPAGPTEEHGA